jgi:DNA invertase Pin-like site-specific DNA recombinase
MTFGPAPYFKKATIFAYTRISTDKQSVDDKKQTDPKKKASLKRQFKEIKDALKAQGLPVAKPENWFAEVASGTKVDRTQWIAARRAAMANEGPTVMVVKDPSRWARNVDAAVNAWSPLKERGIPVYAVITGVQTGTALDRRPSENFFFLLNSGFAAQVSEVQQKKAEAGRDRQREEGAADFKGASVFPFALKDPVTVFNENIGLLSTKNGVPDLKRMIDAGTNPNGMTFSAATAFIKRMEELKVVLNPAEYEEYTAFRERLRERLVRLDSDAWATKGNKEGKLDYRANALYRMTGLYNKEPQDYPMPTEDFLDKVEKDFPEYLSDKDKNRRGKKRL